MRLHIVPDEKIINRCINNFDTVFPNDNKYVVLTKTPEKPKYVKEQKNVFFRKYDTDLFWDTVGDIKSYTAVIIHFLIGDSVLFVNRIDHSNIYWIEWGADLYLSLLKPRGFQLYADKEILWKINSKYKFKTLFKLHRFFSEKKQQRLTLNAAKKARYFVPDSMYDEYPLLLNYYPQLKHLEYRNFFYYPIDEILGPHLIDAYVKGNSIMVGNSASVSNNHLNVIQKLKTLELGDRQIVMPLSYGGISKYIKMVENTGSATFGDYFFPIKDYMPLDKYNDLLLSANCFIYGNWRQEAVGNILIALYIGGKVFLDEHNPLLMFYKNHGLKIYGLEELTSKEVSIPLQKEFVEENRKILRTMYSRERQLELIKKNF